MIAKKGKTKTGVQPSQHSPYTHKEAGTNRFSDFILFFVCLLYLAVHFLPNFGALDAFGFQWLFIVGIDMLTMLYIFSKKKEYFISADSVFNNIFSKIYSCFFVLAGLSIITAINPTEGWVCFVRIIATLIAFFNLAILLYGRLSIFKWIAQLMGCILLVESLQTISQFLAGAGNISFDALILSLKGNTGNKNIFAADLAIKIPFVLYCIHTGKLWTRIFNILILFFSVFTLFIVNARASYLSLFLILILYFIFLLSTYLKERKHIQSAFQLSYIIVPFLAAFLGSQLEVSHVKSLQEEKGGYGTVSERISTITSISGNQDRLQLWSNAIDYTTKHPFMGSGIGNWKLASIPYEKTKHNDGTVSLHVHNDFLENFAELGIPGGILYLGLFVSILFFTITVLRSESAAETKMISFISFLSFIGYSIDAFFNFPFERPITQVLFALITGLNINAFIQATQKSIRIQKRFTAKNLYCLLAFIFLLPAGYITYQTYQSLVAQNTIIADHENQPLHLTWHEVLPVLPAIPNLSVLAQPIDAIEARYLMEADKNEEALILLKKASQANPFFGYAEFLKAVIYTKLDKMDSAFSNAIDAFYKRPRAIPRYQTLIAVLAKMKDTVNIQQAYEEVIQYRNEPYVWNLYLMGMLQAKIKGSEKLLQLADSALKLFPDNTDLISRRNEIAHSMGMSVGPSNKLPVDNTRELQYFSEGVANFNQAKEFASQNNAVAAKEKNRLAVKNFLLASEANPKNFVYHENAGLAYLHMNDFTNALIYLKKALTLKTATDGKTEYFTGIVLLNLGKKEDGCNYLQTALSLGWKDAGITINSNCK